ncbi:exgA [Acrasis kona]|uniref:ExgA n=1 Tax=Acrasis kona TaxID=1008807 RepID=A0AAW2Z6J8_9EUKA
MNEDKLRKVIIEKWNAAVNSGSEVFSLKSLRKQIEDEHDVSLGKQKGLISSLVKELEDGDSRAEHLTPPPEVTSVKYASDSESDGEDVDMDELPQREQVTSIQKNEDPPIPSIKSDANRFINHINSHIERLKDLSTQSKTDQSTTLSEGYSSTVIKTIIDLCFINNVVFQVKPSRTKQEYIITITSEYNK